MIHSPVSMLGLANHRCATPDRLELKVTAAFFFGLETDGAKTDEYAAKRNQYWGPVDIKENWSAETRYAP